ncbi:hypothetical protein [Flavobacterium aestivum]|uniref:hypothetical protein n=1 Tax=Flavobacterium aestivum TaxID=3003257 RepID=UPI002285550F|nr:hypothetical protein [Flavobacterium aestivum]
MSYIKELTEAHDTIKGLALILFLVPFWYIAIFLFNNEFYQKSELILIISFCLVFSFLSSILFALLLMLTNDDTSKPSIFLQDMVGAICILIIWISSLIFIIYSLGFLFKMYIYFYWFVVIYFFPIFIGYILMFLFQKK